MDKSKTQNSGKKGKTSRGKGGMPMNNGKNPEAKRGATKRKGPLSKKGSDKKIKRSQGLSLGNPGKIVWKRFGM